MSARVAGGATLILQEVNETAELGRSGESREATTGALYFSNGGIPAAQLGLGARELQEGAAGRAAHNASPRAVEL